MQTHQLENNLPIHAPPATPVDTTRYLRNVEGAQVSACVDGATTTMNQVPVPVPAGSYEPTSRGFVDLERLSGVSYVDLSQGSVNMCTSMALAHGFALLSALRRRGSAAGPPPPPPPPLSPTFAYYYQRVTQCETQDVCRCPSTGACAPPCLDCGSLFSTALQVFATGVASASAWPAVLAPASAVNSTPSPAAVAEAPRYRVPSWTCLSRVDPGVVADAVLSERPVLLFWNVSANIVQWMAAQQHVAGLHNNDGSLVVAPAFDPAATPVLGHAVLVVGTSPDGFILRNSFGNAWGSGGRFLISYADFTPAAVRTAVSLDGVAAT